MNHEADKCCPVQAGQAAKTSRLERSASQAALIAVPHAGGSTGQAVSGASEDVVGLLGLEQAVVHSISQLLRLDQKQRMYNNILLMGGGACTKARSRTAGTRHMPRVR